MAVLKYPGMQKYDNEIKGWIEGENSNIVHKTGDQTLTGVKTFQNSHEAQPETVPGVKSSALYLRLPTYVKGTALPATLQGAGLEILDATHEDIEWLGRIASLESKVSTLGTQTDIVVYKPEIIDGVASTDRSGLSVGFDANGVAFAKAPSTALSRVKAGSRTEIVTNDYLDYYEPRLRFASIPAYSVTLAEAATATSDSPYIIDLSDTDVSGVWFSMDAPQGASTIAAYVYFDLSGGETVVYAISFVSTSGDLRNQLVVLPECGMMRITRIAGDGTAPRSPNVPNSVPAFVGDNIFIRRIRFIVNTAGVTTIPAGTTITVYAASKEVV